MPFKLSFILLLTIIKSLRLRLIISYFFISLSLRLVIGFTDFSAKISLFSEFSNWTLTTKRTGFCSPSSTQSPTGAVGKVWNLTVLRTAEHISNWSAHQVESESCFHSIHSILLLLEARMLAVTNPKTEAHAPDNSESECPESIKHWPGFWLRHLLYNRKIEDWFEISFF